jgi:hypothetical protein
MVVTDFLPLLLDKQKIKVTTQRGLKYVDIYVDACQQFTSRISWLGTGINSLSYQTSDNSTFI